jgi:predicted TIM-barrel fold metal-dependent hydrolase
MTRNIKPALVALGAALFSAVLMGWQVTAPLDAVLKQFADIDPIDTHVHLYKDDASLRDLISALHLRAVDICLIDDRDPFFRQMEPQREDVLKVVRATGGRVRLCTTFSPYAFEQRDFAGNAIRQLNRDFADGAIAVKIYKTIGMEIRNHAGKYLLPDDPVFKPIFDDIAAHNRTVIAHLAEPDSCWEAPNPASPDYEYYEQNPQEYAYKHPEWPSKQAILDARDHLLEQNPNLRVVGAHLGSMEADVDQIARRFDRYPNFAVDTAARVPYLMIQPRAKVRDFLMRYQDRVLYATDLVVMPNDDTQHAIAQWKKQYETDWKFFATSEKANYKGHEYTGLELPRPVLRKLFHDNAMRWIAGLAAGSADPQR